MSGVKKYFIEAKYRKENGVCVFDSSPSFPDDFRVQIREQTIVRIPPGLVAGNHRHPRREAYISYDSGVELHWLDQNGEKHVEIMGEMNGVVALFVIHSMVPHAVINTSGKIVTVYGFADGPLEEVEPAVIVTDEHRPKKLSKKEIAAATELLSRLQPGVLPFTIFHEVTRLVVTPIIEVVPLRLNANGKIEILLLQREADDPIWPGQLHVPGTVIRASDAPGSFEDALDRVLSKELAETKNSSPIFVENILHHSGRGVEASQIFWLEVSDGSPIGSFWDVNKLPDSLVRSQLDFIPRAIKHFIKYKSLAD